MTDNTHLPRWAYITLALLAAVIGLASSAVTTQFFVLGLERTEPDTLARNALIAAGVLMIVTELAAFGLSALLPKKLLRALRWRLIACGFVLLAFETSTIFVTQMTLAKSSESISGSVSTRMADLRASIDSKRATAAGLRANAASQSRSLIASSRAAGGDALRQAMEIERQIEPMATDLARLQAGKITTTTEALGGSGMLIYNFARAFLISAMGLVMFTAAGSLLRAASAVSPVTLRAPDATGAPAAPQPSTPKVTLTKTPTWTSAMPKPAYAAAVMPMGVMAAPMATYAPPLPTPPSISVPAVIRQAPSGVSKQAHPAPSGVSEQTHPKTPQTPTLTQQGAQADTPAAAPAQPAKAKKHKARSSVVVADGQKMDTGTTGNTGYRYRRVKAAVQAKTLKPSTRAIRRAEGGGAPTIRGYLAKMLEEGVIRLKANEKGYELVKADESQMQLEGV